MGAVTPDLESLANKLNGVRLAKKGPQWIEPIKEEVDKLTKQGINKIVLITHCGLPYEKILAKELPQVDVIVGGHSHTRLEKWLVEKHPEGNSTVIVQTGCYGRAVGELKLAFDARGRLQLNDSRYHLVDITDKITEDSDLTGYVAKMAESLSPNRHATISTATKAFGDKNGQADSAIGDLICDSLVDLGKKDGVTIAMHNRGGIRGNIQDGPITITDIQQILPFDNFVVFATVNGALIKQTLEHSVSDGLGGKFLDVAGLKFAYDRQQPEGKRVVFVLVQDDKGKWSPLKSEKRYKMAMNHYNFEGGEGYNFKSAEEVNKTETKMSDTLEKYLVKHTTISPGKPNRIVEVRSGSLDFQRGREFVQVEGAAPQARVSVVAGTGPGVSTIYSAFPVPLENARVMRTNLSADRSGRLTVRDVQSIGRQYKREDSRMKGDDFWMCIVAHPSKRHGGASGKTIISNPIKIGEERSDDNDRTID